MLSRYCDCKLLWDPTDRWKLCWVRRLTSSLHPVSRQPGHLQYINPAVACSTAITGVTMAQAVSRCPSLETVQESGTRDQGASTRCDWGKIIYWWSPVLHFQRQPSCGGCLQRRQVPVSHTNQEPAEGTLQQDMDQEVFTNTRRLPQGGGWGKSGLPGVCCTLCRRCQFNIL